jgi:predicted nuclease of predicted toxin-antitoxin system
MVRYLIDANLPYFFSLWKGPDCVHLRDLDDSWTDSQVWSHAKQEGLTIVSKDTDFSDRILLATPPPRVIHIRVGNLKMRDFHQAIAGRWADICDLSRQCKLVRVFEDRIEGID